MPLIKKHSAEIYWESLKEKRIFYGGKQNFWILQFSILKVLLQFVILFWSVLGTIYRITVFFMKLSFNRRSNWFRVGHAAEDRHVLINVRKCSRSRKNALSVVPRYRLTWLTRSKIRMGSFLKDTFNWSKVSYRKWSMQLSKVAAQLFKIITI